MNARYATAVTTATGVTFGLLFLMQLMIATGTQVLNADRTIRFVDFVKLNRDTPVETKRDRVDPPTPPQTPPLTPHATIDPTGPVSVAWQPPGTEATVIHPVTSAMTDGEYIPIVTVAPHYPARALSQGIEGYVIVEYTVTTTGGTRDPVIVESSNTVFDRAALDSVLKYRYRPRVIDGEPVEVSGVRRLIRFELDD